MPAGLPEERSHERDQRRVAAIAGAHDEEPLIERDLVVAAAAGVEVSGVLADELAQPPLDVGVDVLQRRIEGDVASHELLAHLGEPRVNPPGGGGGGKSCRDASIATCAREPRMSSS